MRGAARGHNGFGTLELRAARYQMIAVEQRPSVILRVGQLQVFGADVERQIDDALDMIDVEPVDDAVHDHGKAMALDQLGGAPLEVEGAGARQKVVHLARGILERKLDVIEPGLLSANECASR